MSTPIQSLFKSGKNPVGTRGIIENKSNPLNWYERMRERRANRKAQEEASPFPVAKTSNAGLADIIRNVDDRMLIATSRKAQGDGKEVAKIASMDDTKYYKTRSNVLNLARMNTNLRQQIRNAMPGDIASPPQVEAVAMAADGEAQAPAPPTVARPATPPIPAVEAQGPVLNINEGAEEGQAPAQAVEAVVQGVAADGDVALQAPEGYAELKTAIDRLPEPEKQTAADGDVLPEDMQLSMEEKVAKYGAVKNAPISVMMDVVLGKYPTNEAAKKSILEFFRNVNVPIGSRKNVDFMLYEATGKVGTDAQINEVVENVKERLQRMLVGAKVPMMGTKKEFDKYIDDNANLMKTIVDLDKYFTDQEQLKPFEASFETEKESLRQSVNGIFSLMNSKVPQEYKVNLEVRQGGSGRSEFGKLYLNGKPFNANSSFIEFTKAAVFLQQAREQLTGSPQYSDEDYPSLKKVFDNLDKQREAEAKQFRLRSTGGRPPGSKNTPKTPKTPREVIQASVQGAVEGFMGGAGNPVGSPIGSPLGSPADAV